jgi:TPP-dependent indolepyruvate ferredoxin oxidoreductase alpha subunit
MTASSDEWMTRATNFSMLSQDAEASGSTANNKIALEILDGTSNTPRAGLYMRLDKGTNKASLSLEVYNSSGTKIGSVDIDESGVEMYSRNGHIYANGTRLDS